MKKLLIIFLVLMPFIALAQDGSATGVPWVRGPRANPQFWTFPNGVGYRWHNQVESLLGATGAVGGATNRYVNSNVTNAGDGSSWSNAVATTDAAINLCDANDYIHVAPGHAESGADADLWDADVAGITIKHYGNGSDQGTYTFADTDTTVAVGAANVTIIGGRLLAGISEVVVGLSVEATAHYLTVLGMECPEPGTTTFEFNIAIQLTSDVNDISFIGCRASSSTAGADHWLNGGAAAVQRLTLIGNIIHGEYAIAPIFSDQADTETYIRGNLITQLTASQFGIEFSGNATGVVADNRVNATVLFEVDPGTMAYWNNLEGDTLPEGVSLNGQLGAFTGPAAGAAQDDNVKGSLDLAHIDLDAILADTISISGGTLPAAPTSGSLATFISGGSVGLGAPLPASKSLFDIIGDEYTDDGGNDNLDSVAAHINFLSKYIADGDGDFAAGAAMPSNKSIYDITGAYTADAGADDEDTIMAHLDLILADTKYINDLAMVTPVADSLGAFIASGGTAAGTNLADSKSIIDAVGHTGTAFHTSGVGYWIEKTITQTAANNADSDDLFDVAGGDILITSFVIIATELIDSNATTLQIICDRDDEATNTEFTTAVNVETDVLGTVYVFTDANPAVLTPLTPGATGSSTLMSPWYCMEGMVESIFSAANLDGTFKYLMTYKPLETGVTVTAQ